MSGVTKLRSGTAVNPNCQNTTTRGIQYSMPSYTNLITAVNNSITARCNLTGEPINAGKRVDVDPSNPDPLTARYFNLAAFAMPTPLSATVGDFGNAPLGLLLLPDRQRMGRHARASDPLLADAVCASCCKPTTCSIRSNGRR